MRNIGHYQKTGIFMLFFCLTAGIFAAGGKVAIREPITAELVPQGLIQQTGWTYNWQLNLPIKLNETIDRLYVFDDYLYVLTNSNILFCVNRSQGRMLFSVRLSELGLPVCEPIYYEGRLGFITGNQMQIFDPASGIVQQKEVFEQVGDAYECAVARNKRFIYVAGSDRRLHAISTDGFWQVFTATADNDSAILSIIATDSIVVLATQAGNIVGMQPDAAKKLWQYDASGQILAKVVSDGEFIYAGGMDAKLYKLDIGTGKLLWSQPFHAGAPIRDAATIGKDVVYIWNNPNGMYAVDKNKGCAAWNLPGGQHVICESGDKAFVFALPGVLKVMDNKTGKELYSVNFNQVERYAQNMKDAAMYVADTGGRLMSITVR